MALTLCPECNKEVSDKATTCIHCGNPLQANGQIAAYAVPQSGPRKKKSYHALKVFVSAGWVFVSMVIIGTIINHYNNTNSKPVSPSFPTSSSESSSTADTSTEATGGSGDLQVSNLHVGRGEFGVRSIRGTVTNNSNTYSYNYAQVEINLYDASGNQVGSTLANVNNLEPGKSWNFEAPITEEHVKSFKVMKVSGL